MSVVVRQIGRDAALVTGIAAGSPPTMIEPDPTREAMASLGEGVGWVVMAVDAPDEATLRRLLAFGRPLATGTKSIDALKLVAGTVIVETLDRDEVVAAGLPAVVELSQGRRALAAARGLIPVADLVSGGDEQPVLVDDQGNEIGDPLT